MTPIINPMWFYWLSVLSVVRAIMIGILFVGASGAVFSAAVWMLHFDDDTVNAARKFTRVFCAIFLVASLAGTFVPSQETLITMKVAEYATYETAEVAIDAIKSAAQYIIEAMTEAR